MSEGKDLLIKFYFKNFITKFIVSQAGNLPVTSSSQPAALPAELLHNDSIVYDAAEALAVAHQAAGDLIDVPTDKKSESLNIISIHESGGSGMNALSSARLLGNQYLDKAVVLLHEIPFNLGSTLGKLSFGLRPNFAGGSSR